MIYAIIAVLILILTCILFLPVTAELSYKEKAELKISFLKIPIYRTEFKRKEKESATPEEKAKTIEKASGKLGKKIDGFKEFYKIATRLLSKYVTIDSISLKLDFGTGDAPSTAILIGVLWASLYGVIGRIGSICKIKKHDVFINPHYNEETFSFEGKCIIKSKLAYIIIIAITILMKIKSRKGKEE